MEPQTRLYRERAIKHYMRGKEDTVLPRFVTPRVFLFLWMVFVLMILAGGLAWYTEYPVYQTNVAFVTSDESAELTTLTILLAVDAAVKPGDSIVLSTEKGRFSANVEAISEDVLSPADIRAQLNLDPGLSMAISQPARVVTVNIPADHISPDMYEGGFLPIEVEVGSQRILSLVPVIGEYFED